MKSDIEAKALPKIRFNYIPEGFILLEDLTFKSSTELVFTYKNERNDFLRVYAKGTLGSPIDNADNEYSSYYIIEIDGISAMWINYDDENQLIISDNHINFNIIGKISLEEIVQIYENIEIL